MTAALSLWVRRLAPLMAVLALVAGVLYAAERHGRRAVSASRAHQATVYAESYVYRTDTLYRRDTVRYRAAVTSYRTLRDTLRLTDTIAVQEGFRRADSALSRADSMLASGATTIRARDTLVVRVKEELAAAAPSRLSARAVALYDPLSAMPAATIEASLRVVGRVSLVARGDQRFAPGERPRAYVGVAFAW